MPPSSPLPSPPGQWDPRHAAPPGLHHAVTPGPPAVDSPDGRTFTVSRRAVSRRAVFRGGLAAVVTVYLFSVVGSAEMAPPHALVFADRAAGTYAAPACAAGRGGAELTTKGAADARGLRPDPECWRNGGFIGSGGSRWMELLRRLRLYPQRESRWRADGTWRW